MKQTGKNDPKRKPITERHQERRALYSNVWVAVFSRVTTQALSRIGIILASAFGLGYLVKNHAPWYVHLLFIVVVIVIGGPILRRNARNGSKKRKGSAESGRDADRPPATGGPGDSD